MFASSDSRRFCVGIPFLPLLAKTALNVRELSLACITAKNEFLRAALLSSTFEVVKPNQTFAASGAFCGVVFD
jgi:hypothetical protein